MNAIELKERITTLKIESSEAYKQASYYKKNQLDRIKVFLKPILELSDDEFKVSMCDYNTIIHITNDNGNSECDLNITYDRIDELGAMYNPKDNVFGISWMSTNACTENTPIYLRYLSVLGRVSDNLQTIKNFLLDEIEIHTAIYTEGREVHRELDNLEYKLRKLEDEALINDYIDRGTFMFDGDTHPPYRTGRFGKVNYDGHNRDSIYPLKITIKKVTDKTITFDVTVMSYGIVSMGEEVTLTKRLNRRDGEGLLKEIHWHLTNTSSVNADVSQF
jgi:hypothetical protein